MGHFSWTYGFSLTENYCVNYCSESIDADIHDSALLPSDMTMVVFVEFPDPVPLPKTFQGLCDHLGIVERKSVLGHKNWEEYGFRRDGSLYRYSWAKGKK